MHLPILLSIGPSLESRRTMRFVKVVRHNARRACNPHALRIYIFDLDQNTNYFKPISKIHGPSIVLLKNFQAEFLASTSLNAAGFATMI